VFNQKPTKQIPTTFALGQELIDDLTGFCGYAYQLLYQDNGNLRISLQPKSNSPSKLEEAISFDIHTLSIVSGGYSDRIPPVTPFKYMFGDRVKDRLTGFNGIIVCRAYFINGCAFYEVVSEKLDKDQRPVCSWIPERYIELVKIRAISPPEKTKTGGPPTKVSFRG